jgi:undecaprenyl diphosphate synthase
MSAKTVPTHVAMIMDGNGRWAEQHHKARIQGHREGAERLREVLQVAQKAGIKVVSVFAFSSENWNRPKDEVDALMKLFSRFLQKAMKELPAQNVQLRVIGDLSRFPRTLQNQIQKTVELTRQATAFIFVIAVSYGGQWDIIQATKKIATLCGEKKIAPDEITPALFEQYLSLPDLPPPDLLIRTSGEERISNFFLWQLAYTEMYFTKTYWPDFGAKAFERALEEYATRHRRFGKVLC